MIFPVIKTESVVQVNDKTRIDAKSTYTSPDEAAITLFEIEPEASAGFFNVTSSLYLDWQYSTDGDKTITLRVTTDGSPESVTQTISVKSVADDKLFSTDSELLPYEPDILNYVTAGRSSFLDVHRASQQRIIKKMEENGFFLQDGGNITLDQLLDIEEFRDWSRFMTLRLIFEGRSNATDDIFHAKALRYRNLEAEASDRARIKVDLDGDGVQESEEEISFRSVELLKE